MAITLVKDEKPAGPFCEDCKHCVVNEYLNGDRTFWCHAPQNEKSTNAMALVTRRAPKPAYRIETAHLQRGIDSDEYCGPEGKWFEPRTSEPTSHPSEEVAA